jgi:hypothetical protein
MYEDDTLEETPYDSEILGEYGPDNPEYFEPYEYDDASAASERSNSYKKNKKGFRSFNTVKSTDPAFNTVKRIIDGKPSAISYYCTGIRPGTAIRDAITGAHDPTYRVGKYDEYLFFKVCMATGEGKRGNYGEVETQHLYYDSPEQYEKHFYTTVDSSVKTAWYERYRSEMACRKSEEEEASRRMTVQIK